MATPRPHRRSPALDGLRGFALLGMLAWHAQIGWIQGGFARMTVFFVLAGFLAAGSFERQQARGAPRPFFSFWKRRARRLLPITILGVLWALAVTAWIGSSDARDAARGDSLSVLLSFSNWRFIADQRPYGALFDAPSAFQHYWSLSLEEQCFLLLPLFLGVAVLASRSRHPGRMALVLAAMAAAFGLLPLVIEMGPDTAYYGTHVRIGEFLAGAALAVWLRDRDLSRLRSRTHYRINLFGLLSLASLVLVMLFVGREQAWLYRGGMILFALPVVAVLLAVSAGSRGVTNLLSVMPLRALGRWALSIYAVHWPLYLLIEHAWPAMPRAWLASFELAAAIVLGAVVFAAVEQPLMLASRTSRPRLTIAYWWHHDRAAFSMLGSAAVLAVVATFAIPHTPPVIDFAAAEQIVAEQQLQDPAVDPGSSPGTGHLQQPGQLDPARPARKLRVGVFNGSTALMLAMGQSAWSDNHPRATTGFGYVGIGCGLMVDGVRQFAFGTTAEPLGDPSPPPEACDDWPAKWKDAVVRHHADIAVVPASQWDRANWILDGQSGVVRVGNDRFDRQLLRQMQTGADVLHDNGVLSVVFLTSPATARNRGGRLNADEQQRADDYNQVLDQLAASRPWVRVVDYGAWADALPADRMAELLPDGIHPSTETAKVIWREYLGPAVERAVPELR